MLDTQTPASCGAEEIEAAVSHAVRAIPPMWPLASSVAVNPFLGQTASRLGEVGARLRRISGARVTMPRSWYREQIDAGSITSQDLLSALAEAPVDLRPATLGALKGETAHESSQEAPLPCVSDLAAQNTGTDWSGIVAERIGAWAAAYFDEGQALWIAPRGRGAYDAWRASATHDLTPEILGLPGFARHVSEAPDTAEAAIARAVEVLGLRPEALPTYFHQLLLNLGGWSQYARYKLWQAELAGGQDATLSDLLAIRLVWEEALFGQLDVTGKGRWSQTIASHAAPVSATASDIVDEILQEAAERAAQRRLAAALCEPARAEPAGRPSLQAAFCIDVRSEVFRRALEGLDPGIQTIGFAGFFGLATAHRRFASDVVELRLPVLLNPGVHSCSGGEPVAAADQKARIGARAVRAWGRFKLAAVSSFAFVEATGPLYAAKLLGSALGLGKGKDDRADPAPRLEPALDLAARTEAAGRVLRAMSLTSGFSRLVLLLGHGADVVNNPHASGLHCGACGGYSGEVNAQLLAQVLNDPKVREGLAASGIQVPADTVFLAGLHHTTTDEVTLYETPDLGATHGADVAAARAWLEAAGRLTRAERALRFPGGARGEALLQRSRDWSQVRPEWALAGCKAFIAAPRRRTSGRSLGGRAFLHDYDWKQDSDFGVLELILTAPVVVASWISLQYYGSTVAPGLFGGGNKLIHNVTGGVGVVEGNGGLLRAGLPWQSVHDGERYIHEPLRLSVCVEAPREAISAVISRHPLLRDLFDNHWLHLFALDETGQIAWRYAGDLNWRPMEVEPGAAQAQSLPLAG